LNQAVFIQLAASGAAVAAMVALAAWANIARPTLPLDDALARRQLAEEFPGRDVEGLWIAVDGLGAVAKSGAMALVLCRLGDGYVARQIPWAQALAASFKDGRISIDLADVAAPRAVIALETWPPRGPPKDLSGKERAA
jgi:HAMP domain-containing protein